LSLSGVDLELFTENLRQSTIEISFVCSDLPRRRLSLRYHRPFLVLRFCFFLSFKLVFTSGVLYLVMARLLQNEWKFFDGPSLQLWEGKTASWDMEYDLMRISMISPIIG